MEKSSIVKVIICVLLVIAAVCIIVNFNKNVENNTKNEIANIQSTENTSKEIENTENLEKEIAENVVEEKNEIIEETNTTYQSKDIYEKNDNVGTTDKKQEAINLVKQMWGEDDTVTFRCDSITANGEYIIAVYSTQSATVKNYFKVNLETKNVEVDY